VLNRPSSRRKSHSEGIELNLVPILDTMVTLIGFLLFTTSFLAIVSIESPLPVASPNETLEKVKEKPLQLTIAINDQSVELYSVSDKIPRKSIPNQADGTVDLKALHEAVIEVKKQFPAEENSVLAPKSGIAYETMIAVMDGVRNLEPTDPPIYRKNPQTGVDEPAKNLFPKVVFGNLVTEDK
jgi:biopolymer transport protein ExbD